MNVSAQAAASLKPILPPIQAAVSAALARPPPTDALAGAPLLDPYGIRADPAWDRPLQREPEGRLPADGQARQCWGVIGGR